MSHRPTVSTATPEEVAEALLAKTHKKKLPPATCPLCEKSFIPLRFWQRYCSSECRTKHHSSVTKEEMTAAIQTLIAENKALRARVEELEGKTSETSPPI